jgi:hypothetical protein
MGSLGSKRWCGIARIASNGEGRLGRAVGRRGEARRSQREAGKRQGRGWGDTWTGAEQRWGGRGGAHGQPEQRRRAAEKQRRGGER